MPFSPLFPTRRHARWFLAILALALLSCSHNTPWLRHESDRPGDTPPPDDAVRQRILLIGDAGSPKGEGEPVLDRLGEWAGRLPDRTVVIYLGDNIYPHGLPDVGDPGRGQAEERLDSQLDPVLASGARALMVPGNHDWNSGRAGGLPTVRRQAEYVREKFGYREAYLPEGGCPGPEHIDLPGLRIIALDSHWWLHTHQRGSGCAAGDESASLARLDSLLSTAGDRETVVVAHHPLETVGPHGGFFTWKDHLFPLTLAKGWLYVPLPVIGSLYPISRRFLIRHDQDVFGDRNRHMRHEIGEVLRRHRPLFYAAGHEHSLQVMEGRDLAEMLLVSGCGSFRKRTPVGHRDYSLFAYGNTGIIVVDILKTGEPLLRVVDGASGEVVFERAMR